MNTLKNSVQLIGHIGKDIELRTFDNGKKLTRITLATNEYFKDGKGEKRQETQWHNLTAWGTLADNISSTLTKGNEVAINGKLVYKSYEDKSGATRYVAEIVVNEFMRISKYEKAF